MSNLISGAQESIQLLIAKLVTNPYLARCVIKGEDEFIEQLNMSKEQKVELARFFERHGVRFLAASQLLMKKRLDDIVDAMQSGRKIFSYVLLQGYFEAYLQRIDLNAYIPKNPIAESILFCKYILLYEDIGEKEKNILDYDLTRNLVLHEVMSDTGDNSAIFKDAQIASKVPACGIKAVIHPSVRIKKFPLGTSFTIKAIKDNLPDNRMMTSSLEKEILIFHKNWNKGGVATLRISPDTEIFIKILLISNSLAHAYELLEKETGAGLNVLKPVITRFIECGLCAFQSLRGSYV